MRTNKLFIFSAVLFGLILVYFAFNRELSSLQQIKQNTLRLHVIANSDSEADQNIKLALRDHVLKVTESWFAHCTSKQSVVNTLNKRMGELQAAVDRFLVQNHLTDTASVTLDTSQFPTKYYGTICLPAGKYDALKITIGKGEGQNWWCVLFPQLCVTAAAEVDLCTYYGEDGVKILQSEDITFSFKILEWAGQLWDCFKGLR